MEPPHRLRASETDPDCEVCKIAQAKSLRKDRQFILFMCSSITLSFFLWLYLIYQLTPYAHWHLSQYLQLYIHALLEDMRRIPLWSEGDLQHVDFICDPFLWLMLGEAIAVSALFLLVSVVLGFVITLLGFSYLDNFSRVKYLPSLLSGVESMIFLLSRFVRLEWEKVRDAKDEDPTSFYGDLREVFDRLRVIYCQFTKEKLVELVFGTNQQHNESEKTDEEFQTRTRATTEELENIADLEKAIKGLVKYHHRMSNDDILLKRRVEYNIKWNREELALKKAAIGNVDEN